MRIRGHTGIIFFILLSACIHAYPREKFQASVHFMMGMPQGEFKQNVDSAGFGGSGSFAYRFKRSPLTLGVSTGVLVYGSETRPEFLSDLIPEVVVDVTTRNYILTCHLVLRAQLPKGTFRPYIEGLAGFHYLWTETGVYDQGCCHERIASTVNLSDFAWSFGAGCGVMMKVYEKRTKTDRYPLAMHVDLGACYLKGGKAEYLRKGSIFQENGRLVHDFGMSQTDLLTARLGLSFTF